MFTFAGPVSRPSLRRGRFIDRGQIVVTITFLALLPGIAGCSLLTPEPTMQQELDRSRTRWQTAGPEAYAFTTTFDCFCPPELLEPVRVEVADGQIIAVHDVKTGEAVAESSLLDLYTDVEGLFDRVQREIDRPAEQLEVEYDGACGFPRTIDVDAHLRDRDGGVRLDVRDFEASPP